MSPSIAVDDVITEPGRIEIEYSYQSSGSGEINFNFLEEGPDGSPIDGVDKDTFRSVSGSGTGVEVLEFDQGSDETVYFFVTAVIEDDDGIEQDQVEVTVEPDDGNGGGGGMPLGLTPAEAAALGIALGGTAYVIVKR